MLQLVADPGFDITRAWTLSTGGEIGRKLTEVFTVEV